MKISIQNLKQGVSKYSETISPDFVDNDYKEKGMEQTTYFVNTNNWIEATKNLNLLAFPEDSFVFQGGKPKFYFGKEPKVIFHLDQTISESSDPDHRLI